MMTTYDEGQCLVFMELTWPATVMFKGVSLLGQGLENLARLLGNAGMVIRSTPDAGYVEGLPLEFYAPNGTVEGVMLGVDV